MVLIGVNMVYMVLMGRSPPLCLIGCRKVITWMVFMGFSRASIGFSWGAAPTLLDSVPGVNMVLIRFYSGLIRFQYRLNGRSPHFA